MSTLHVDFPQTQHFDGGTLEYNVSFVRNFNSNINKTQLFLDKTVGTHLQRYVSYKTGTQERSIVNANTYGTGKVMINVPYAEVQAYSKRIHKRVGLRGTQPFERMVADNKEKILRETSQYSKGLGD